MTTASQTTKNWLDYLRTLWDRGWLKGLLLVVAVVFAYQPAWHAGFIWDDDAYVTQNPLLSAPDGLKRIWFSLDSPSQYFPLTYTTFRLERLLWGLDPAGYHWVNILLHAVNALLVWRLLKRLSVPGAWLAAAIFALHPVQVESVAWITERKNVLSLLFSLLALLAWMEFVEERPKPGWRFYFLSLIFYLLALCGKTTACTLPAALLLILWLKKQPVSRFRLAQIIPFLVLGAGMGLVTIWWERYHQGTQGALFSYGPAERVLIASRAVWFYLGKLAWPVNLTFSYPRWTANPANPLAYGWLAAGAGLGAAIYFTRRFAGRGVEVAALFYVATLSPMLGLVMLYTFQYASVADHYQYVASIGPIALAAAGISTALGRFGTKKPFLEPALCIVLLAALCVLTWRQCGMYADIDTLWRVTMAKNPDSWLAHNNLGKDLLRAGQVDEAIAHFQKAVNIEPKNSSAQVNLGIALFQKGRVDEAIAQFQNILETETEPNTVGVHYILATALLKNGQADEAIIQYQKAIEIHPDFARARYDLATVLLQKGRVDEAINQYQKVLEIHPDPDKAHNILGNELLQKTLELRVQPDVAGVRDKLGNALLQKGRVEEAMIQFQMVLEIRPDDADAQINLGIALFKKGRVDEAVARFQKALEISPGNPKACHNLTHMAWVLATCPDASIRNGVRAVALVEQVELFSQGGNPLVLETLATAYAETGRFPEAVATAERAQQLAVQQGNTSLADVLGGQIKLYQAGTAYRDTSMHLAPASPASP
jgi:protein O-mannosyl-transferase